jgi:hypothetical protein
VLDRCGCSRIWRLQSSPSASDVVQYTLLLFWIYLLVLQDKQYETSNLFREPLLFWLAETFFYSFFKLLFSLGWLFKIENPQNTLLQNFTVEQVACTHLESWTINLKHLTDKFSSNKNNSKAFAILSKKITSSLNIFLSVLVFSYRLMYVIGGEKEIPCTQLEVLNLQRWNWTWWHFVCRLHSYWGMWCHCYCSDNEISVISSVHVAWETSLARFAVDACYRHCCQCSPDPFTAIFVLPGELCLPHCLLMERVSSVQLAIVNWVINLSLV